jgi:hypothetical protein
MRAFEFLRGVRHPEVAPLLQGIGWNDDEWHVGWKLLRDVVNVQRTPRVIEESVATKVYAVYAPMFELTKASLAVRHPEQAEFVFGGLELGRPLTVFVDAAIFLDRLVALKASPDRKATRKADLAALETLHARGITEEKRKELKSIIDAETTTMKVSPVESDDSLERLHEWITDWAGLARTVVKKRALLKVLGLGRSRTPKAANAPPVQPPVVVAPKPVAPPPVTPPAAPTIQEEKGPDSRAA